MSNTFGPYQLLYQLGAGGMGQVFLARHTGEHGIQRLVALKRILGHLNRHPELIRLFLEEVRIAAQLNHSNIVQVIDHGRIDDQYYMAMEYVHGENLFEIVNRLRRADQTLPLDILLNIISGVCLGLDYAHRKQGLDGRPLGLVHRDITPHNVMLSFEGEVKLADFGVALASKVDTEAASFGGKLAYMSPEQSVSGNLDQRSDLFSLGVVIYEALSGKNPFIENTSDRNSVLEKLRSGTCEPLSRLRPDVPQDLIAIVKQMMTVDVSQRPQSARAIYEDLQRIIHSANLTASRFAIADFLVALFPETAYQEADDWAESTAVGRRADQTAIPIGDLERKTLFYLKQRKPDGDTTRHGPHPGTLIPAGNPLRRTVKRSRRRTLWSIAILLLGLGSFASLYFGLRTEELRNASVGHASTAHGLLDAEVIRADRAPDSGIDIPAGDTTGITMPTASKPGSPNAPLVGKLEIRTSPSGARVLIDGTIAGKTPLLKKELPIGTHRIRVELPGYRPELRVKNIQADAVSRTRIQLVPKTALVSVSSTKLCTVRVGDRSFGKTPARFRLTWGTHTVTCTARRGWRARRSITLRGSTKKLRFEGGALAINLTPWAKVSVDGTTHGTTPIRLDLPVGEHNVQIENPDSARVRRRTITIRAGQTTRISSW